MDKLDQRSQPAPERAPAKPVGCPTSLEMVKTYKRLHPMFPWQVMRRLPQRTLVSYLRRCAGNHRKLADRSQPIAPSQLAELSDAGRTRNIVQRNGWDL